MTGIKASPLLAAVTFLVALASQLGAKDTTGSIQPVEYVYAVHDETELTAFVFSPGPAKQPRAAIAVFHGGGWSIGEPQWAFPAALRFAEQGLVAIAVQYRLSDQKGITPLEAMEDARMLFRWMRTHADSLGIDPDRIAAYGWSAGAHLAVCAAIFDGVDEGATVSSAPHALILKSPALSLLEDDWARLLLGDRADIREISPDEHVRPGLPPTLILQGDVDTVTPLAGSQRFCDRMKEAGNFCDLQVYEGYGHLFTPAGIPDDGMPQPDRAIVAAAWKRADQFLRLHGFLDSSGRVDD